MTEHDTELILMSQIIAYQLPIHGSYQFTIGLLIRFRVLCLTSTLKCVLCFLVCQ